MSMDLCMMHYCHTRFLIVVGRQISCMLSFMPQSTVNKRNLANGNIRVDCKKEELGSPSNISARTRAVTSYYSQAAIDNAAEKPIVRITPATLLYGTKKQDAKHLLKSAKYLQRELPIRVAHYIAAFRKLPFIVGCNPVILSVHELYIKTFHNLKDFPPIETPEHEREYSSLLRNLLEEHKDVIKLLAQGLLECRKYINDENVISEFLNNILTTRLGMRILAQHQLLLRENMPNHVGIVNTSLRLIDVVNEWTSHISNLFKGNFLQVPQFKLSGHVSAVFPYIKMPLDYMLQELLKNSVSATLQAHPDVPQEKLPPVHITIANNERDFIIKISDGGGGIPHDLMSEVMKYNFTTIETKMEKRMSENVLGNLVDSANISAASKVEGYGFGLPVAAAYAKYLGGNLSLYSMQGLGCDAYIRLRHIDSKFESFWI